LYLRVSTKEQAGKGGESEGYSIPTQRLVCAQKAAAMDAVVVDEFIDAGESARSADRPELQRMLAFLKEEPVDYLIVHKIDRLARNRADDLMITLSLERASVQLVSCTEAIDNSTPSGKLTHGLMALIAEWYSSNLSAEVKVKTLEKLRQGGTPFKAPVGYLNIRRVVAGQEIRTIEIDPERAALVRWAFETYASGDWTLRQLAADLEERGLTTVSSKCYAEKPLPLGTLHRMLTNRYYIGKVRFKEVEYDGKHPGLISAALFERVQSMLAAHGRAGEKQRIHDHYLKGSVWCGECGSRLILSNAKNHQGIIYPYFICIGRQQKRTNCGQKAVLVSTVEQLVEDHWQTVQLSPDYLDQLSDACRLEFARSHEQIDQERAVASRQLQMLREQQRKLLQAHYADAIPLELMRSEQQRLTEDVTRTEARVAASSVAFEAVETNLQGCLALLRDCYRAYRTAQPELRRQLNQAVFTRLIISNRGIVDSELEQPFALLLQPDLLSEKVSGTDEVPETGGKRKAGEAIESTNAGGCRYQAETWSGGTPRWILDRWKTLDMRTQLSCDGWGLNERYVVPPAGLEPATHGLGKRSDPSQPSAAVGTRPTFPQVRRPFPSHSSPGVGRRTRLFWGPLVGQMMGHTARRYRVLASEGAHGRRGHRATRGAARPRQPPTGTVAREFWSAVSAAARPCRPRVDVRRTEHRTAHRPRLPDPQPGGDEREHLTQLPHDDRGWRACPGFAISPTSVHASSRSSPPDRSRRAFNRLLGPHRKQAGAAEEAVQVAEGQVQPPVQRDRPRHRVSGDLAGVENHRSTEKLAIGSSSHSGGRISAGASTWSRRPEEPCWRFQSPMARWRAAISTFLLFGPCLQPLSVRKLGLFARCVCEAHGLTSEDEARVMADHQTRSPRRCLHRSWAVPRARRRGRS